MNSFPTIRHIDDVLPAVAGREEFVVAVKEGGYTVIDYRYELSDSFDDPIRKECRGLKFDLMAGTILARPLHKFWNFGQKESTSAGAVDFSIPHVVMEKMDGSMIHPCYVNDDVVFMTRMGFTDVAKAAQRHFLRDNEVLERALAFMMDCGLTPIFEYIGPDNRIVEAYEKPELVLLQVREITTGAYETMDQLARWAMSLGVRLAPTYPAFTSTADVEAIHARSGGEGVVLVFEDGLFLKIKTEEYRRLHRIRDDVSREHDLAKTILLGEIDDAMPLFDAATQARVQAFADALQRSMEALARDVRTRVTVGFPCDQKTFAVEVLRTASPIVRSCAFEVRKLLSPGGKWGFDEEVQGTISGFILKNCRDAKSFALLRAMLPGQPTFDGVIYGLEAA